MTGMKRVWILIAILTAGLPRAGAAADAGEVFAEATNAGRIGDYEEARKLYLTVAESWEGRSPVLQYNLGNIYFRLDEFGKAVLHYRRALLLDPSHAESRQNLRHAEGKLGFVEFYRPPAVKFLSRFHSEDLRAGAVLAAWITAIVLTALVIFRPRAWITAPGILLVSLGVTLAAAGVLAHRVARQVESERELYFIVVADDSQIRSAPATSAGSVILLPPGSEVRVLDRRAGWSYVEVRDDTRGWAPSEDLAPLRPEAWRQGVRNAG
ncbi:MAG TPA: tetratricopeptide repeat protein [Verrucomicrobiales bacterium]|nr:tetratricopeptide repeat protein [Verrucomicrobiales bacterium]